MTTLETSVTRGSNGIEAKTVIQFGYDGRELHIVTSKRGFGAGLSSTATAWTRTKDNSLTCVLFHDFSTRLEQDRKARCTDKTVRTMHAKALEGIDDVMAAAKAKHPPSKEASQALIEGISLDLDALDEQPVHMGEWTFRFDGQVFPLASMLSVNKIDPVLIAWLLSAKIGDCFSGCECIGHSTADNLTDDVGPTHESNADNLPPEDDYLEDFNSVGSRHHY